MIVELLKPDITPKAEKFVLRHPEAKICHHPLWAKVVEDLGLKSYYLLAVEGENIKAVLPLAGVRSKLFGTRIISQAFSNYGGAISESQEASDLLYNYALQLTTKEKYEYAEFRNIQSFVSPDILTRTDKITMYLSLNKNPEIIWSSFNSKVRNQVRKAEKSNIICFNGGIELLNEFYDLYTIRMKQLGTPCYPKSLMKKILEYFPQNASIFVAKLENKVAGAGFVLLFNGLVEIPWAATLVEYNSLCPNHKLYWSIIEHFSKQGANTFDFGRCSPDKGTYHFKKQWGANPVQLYYQYASTSPNNIAMLNPESDKYSKKIELWKKTPLWITRLLGPYISKQMP